MLTDVVSLLVLASAALAVRAERGGLRGQVYVFKPLTTALLILVALEQKFSAAPSYRYLIAAGLVCSLAGDVFLMLPRERFVEGLVSFLFAHLCYAAAFTFDGARGASAWAAVALVVYGGVMVRALWPGLGSLKVPVLVYVGAILLMAWQASNRWVATGGTSGLLALVGALLFVVSDSALAWDRFRGRFRGAQVLILETYFAAQWLIALST